MSQCLNNLQTAQWSSELPLAVTLAAILPACAGIARPVRSRASSGEMEG